MNDANEHHSESAQRCTGPVLPDTVTTAAIRVFDVDQVGAILGVTGSAVREGIRTGRLRGFIRPGRRLLITEEALAEMLRDMRRQHDAPRTAARLRAGLGRAPRGARRG